MIIQISSGQGPVECELAVSKLYEALKAEFGDITVLSEHFSRFSGERTSITLESENDLSHLEGSIQWICQSSFRPHHKRKNWFVDVSIIDEMQVSKKSTKKTLDLNVFTVVETEGRMSTRWKPEYVLFIFLPA